MAVSVKVGEPAWPEVDIWQGDHLGGVRFVWIGVHKEIALSGAIVRSGARGRFGCLFRETLGGCHMTAKDAELAVYAIFWAGDPPNLSIVPVGSAGHARRLNRPYRNRGVLMGARSPIPSGVFDA